MAVAAREAPATAVDGTAVEIDRGRRLAIEKRNRALLERDLLEGRLAFSSRPYEAHIQYSNFCNMSCVMCHDGTNPPLEKMDPEILDKVAAEVAPSLSVVIPYGGSEPLVVSWDEARHMALRYAIELRMTTNVQFLDEERFHELKDITETLFLSIDSHIPELFEKIRPGSRPERVFGNLATTARLAEEHGLECLAQVVFMTENASTLPETIEYLADVGIQSVNVLQLIDVNGRSHFLDPLIHFSAEYVSWVKEKCVEVARRKRARLIWNVAGWERHDFRARKVPAKARKDWNYRWEQRMKRHVPGYCMNVWNRAQITAHGEVTPCCYATDGDLALGSLATQAFDEIWNGANARDLRRAMATRDYPSLCSTCRFTDTLGPETHLPFVDEALEEISCSAESVAATLSVRSPAHMTRLQAAPVIELEAPAEPVEAWFIAVALGGDGEEVEVFPPAGVDARAEVVRLEVPEAVFERLRPNLGYWWAVLALTPDAERALRSTELRCLIRHRHVPRVRGSTLRYPDEGHLPVADLGGAKEPGWSGARELPPRPPLGERRHPLVDVARHRGRRNGDGSDRGTHARLSPSEYRASIERLRALVREVLPRDATAIVISKGHEELLRLDCARAWHFPLSPAGGYAGHYPPDGEAAVRELEEARNKGAEYLVVPAAALWWLDHYSELTAHLGRYPAVAWKQGTGAVFALGRHPALYGRAREAEVRSHDEALERELRLVRSQRLGS